MSNTLLGNIVLDKYIRHLELKKKDNNKLYELINKVSCVGQQHAFWTVRLSIVNAL